MREVAQKLPRNVHEARVMIRYPVRNVGGKALLDGLTSIKTSDFKVDAEKLRVCLGWLCEEGNNSLYQHVGIDHDTLRSLETSRMDATGRTIQEALDQFDELDARYCSALNMDPVQSSHIPDILREQYSRAGEQRVELERMGEPVLPHRTDRLLAQCFPSLFPDGGGNYRHFSVPLSTAEMLAHTVKFADPRFSQHYRYIFMMVNMKNLDMAYRGIAPALKGRILKSKVDGTVVDFTEDMFEKFSRVVCDMHEVRALITGFQGQQGAGDSDCAEPADIQVHPWYWTFLGQPEDTDQPHGRRSGTPERIRNLQLCGHALDRYGSAVRFVRC